MFYDVARRSECLVFLGNWELRLVRAFLETQDEVYIPVNSSWRDRHKKWDVGGSMEIP